VALPLALGLRRGPLWVPREGSASMPLTASEECAFGQANARVGSAGAGNEEERECNRTTGSESHGRLRAPPGVWRSRAGGAFSPPRSHSPPRSLSERHQPSLVALVEVPTRVPVRVRPPRVSWRASGFPLAAASVKACGAGLRIIRLLRSSRHPVPRLEGRIVRVWRLRSKSQRSAPQRPPRRLAAGVAHHGWVGP
jgi:hypothetical protein